MIFKIVQICEIIKTFFFWERYIIQVIFVNYWQISSTNYIDFVPKRFILLISGGFGELCKYRHNAKIIYQTQHI